MSCDDKELFFSNNILWLGAAKFSENIKGLFYEIQLLPINDVPVLRSIRTFSFWCPFLVVFIWLHSFTTDMRCERALLHHVRFILSKKCLHSSTGLVGCRARPIFSENDLRPPHASYWFPSIQSNFVKNSMFSPGYFSTWLNGEKVHIFYVSFHGDACCHIVTCWHPSIICCIQCLPLIIP